MFKSRAKEEGYPTLWECWQDVHTWKDFKDFLPLLEPRWVVRTTRWVRHPVGEWRYRQRAKWAKSIQVGDKVCTCSLKHVTVTEKRDWDQILGDDGAGYSLMNCCDQIQADDSCHTPYVTETFTSDYKVDAVSPASWGSE